jgi:hypothetical protein
MYFKQFLTIEELEYNGRLYSKIIMTKENYKNLLNDMKKYNAELYNIISTYNVPLKLKIYANPNKINDRIENIKHEFDLNSHDDKQMLMLYDIENIYIIVDNDIVFDSYYSFYKNYSVNKPLKYGSDFHSYPDFVEISWQHHGGATTLYANNWVRGCCNKYTFYGYEKYSSKKRWKSTFLDQKYMCDNKYTFETNIKNIDSIIQKDD